MIDLSVNINKIATIRNARGGVLPSVVEAAVNIQKFGADGITIHPRPDERHITEKDVYDLKDVVNTDYNIEGYPNERFIQLIKDVKPNQATLVPDPPGVLTSNAGWDTIENQAFLIKVIQEIKPHVGRISLFIETDLDLIAAAKSTGADRIELYTGPYAENPEETINDFKKAAQFAKECGLGINAGHDLSLDNLELFAKEIPFLDEVSIGHALISDALYYGLENVVQMYQRKLGK
jgi:pyridoxine 5-phosphate synthase